MPRNDKCTKKEVNREVRYITKGITETNKMNPILYLKIWDLYDEMLKEVSERDYLQVFELKIQITNKGMIQEITHSQEIPKYAKVHKYYTDRPVEEKIYIVKDDNNYVMMLSSEY